MTWAMPIHHNDGRNELAAKWNWQMALNIKSQKINNGIGDYENFYWEQCICSFRISNPSYIHRQNKCLKNTSQPQNIIVTVLPWVIITPTNATRTKKGLQELQKIILSHGGDIWEAV